MVECLEPMTSNPVTSLNWVLIPGYGSLTEEEMSLELDIPRKEG